MNVYLHDATVQGNDDKHYNFEEFFVKARNIRYVQIPEDVRRLCHRKTRVHFSFYFIFCLPIDRYHRGHKESTRREAKDQDDRYECHDQSQIGQEKAEGNSQVYPAAAAGRAERNSTHHVAGYTGMTVKIHEIFNFSALLFRDDFGITDCW